MLSYGMRLSKHDSTIHVIYEVDENYNESWGETDHKNNSKNNNNINNVNKAIVENKTKDIKDDGSYMKDFISNNNKSNAEMNTSKENNNKVSIVIKDENNQEIDEEEEDDDVITEEEERLIFAKQGNLFRVHSISSGRTSSLNILRKKSDANEEWANNYKKLRRASVMIKASPAAIDTKIEMALDLLKSHLLYAVKEEVESLKKEVEMIRKGNILLERENEIMRQASRESFSQNKTLPSDDDDDDDDDDYSKKLITKVDFNDKTGQNVISNSLNNEIQNNEPIRQFYLEDSDNHAAQLTEHQTDSTTQTSPMEELDQPLEFRASTPRQVPDQEDLQGVQRVEMKPIRQSAKFLQQLSEPSQMSLRRSRLTSLPQNNSADNFLSFAPQYNENASNNYQLNPENMLVASNPYESLLGQNNSQSLSLTPQLINELNRHPEMLNLQKDIQQLKFYNLQRQASLYPALNYQEQRPEFNENANLEQQILLKHLQTIQNNQTPIRQLQQLSQYPPDQLSSFLQHQSLPSSLSSSPPQYFNFNPSFMIQPPKNQRLEHIKEATTSGNDINRLQRISSDPNFHRK